MERAGLYVCDTRATRHRGRMVQAGCPRRGRETVAELPGACCVACGRTLRLRRILGATLA